MNNEYEFVDELDEDSEYSHKDWANYLVKEKKATLDKIRDVIGLKKPSEDNVGSVDNGSAFSQLDSKNGLYKIRYKYARGMKKTGESREFCSEMMRLSDSGLVWRIEDIDNASFGKLVIKNGKGVRKEENVKKEFRQKQEEP